MPQTSATQIARLSNNRPDRLVATHDEERARALHLEEKLAMLVATILEQQTVAEVHSLRPQSTLGFARGLNGVLRRKGKVWADRHHRRDLATPTETRNTLLYVLQNYVHHGMKTFGDGVVDVHSSAPRFDGWADEQAILVETEPWPKPKPRTWMLAVGWLRGRGGRLRTSEHPRVARSVRHASNVLRYVPGRTLADDANAPGGTPR
jgi:hypothetical protein